MASAGEESRVNPYFLNQAGQDTVQDIVCKAQEVFQTLKVFSLPNGTSAMFRSSQERVNKLKELLSTMEQLFKRLRVIYIEYQKHVTEVEDVTILVPMLQIKEGEDQEKPSKSAKEQMLELRKRELESQLRIKNQQLVKLSTLMKKLVWDMNAVSSCMGMKTEKSTPDETPTLRNLMR